MLKFSVPEVHVHILFTLTWSSLGTVESLLLLSDGIFAKELNSVLEMPILLGSSQRSVAMREAFTQWMDKVSSKHRFAPSLVEELAVEAFGRQTLCAKTGMSQYEKMWSGYHSFTTSGKLVEMWSKALESPSTEAYFPLL